MSTGCASLRAFEAETTLGPDSWSCEGRANTCTPVERCLKVEGFLAGVLHHHFGVEGLARQSGGEEALELLVPNGLGVLRRRQPHGHRGVVHGGHFPVHVAREAVLLNGARAKLRKAMAQAAADGLAAVDFGVWAHRNPLGAVLVTVLRGHATEQVNFGLRARWMREFHVLQSFIVGLHARIHIDFQGMV